MRRLLACAVAVSALVVLGADGPQERFAAAAALARSGDFPKAIAAWGELASSGHESASLYWNWAQAASARGARGEALWALLRARELDPADRAVSRDIERVREALALDAAEVSPDPRPVIARWGRFLRLDLVAALLVVASLLARALVHRFRRPAAATAWSTGVAGLLILVTLLAASVAGSQAVVVRKGAALLDGASANAEAVGALREGEVVPVLGDSGEWIRVEDSSGARGWAHTEDVRRLDQAPARP